jgi:hypothetical protein
MIPCSLIRGIMDCLRIGSEKGLELLEIGIGQITGGVQSTRNLDGEVETIVERPRSHIIRLWDTCSNIIDSRLQSVIVCLIVGCEKSACRDNLGLGKRYCSCSIN